MKKQVGLWINHRGSVIVTFTGEAEETKRITSNMEKHVRFSGAAQASSGEDTRDNKFSGHLSKYYEKVSASIHDAESILIFGPGEAKIELKKQLENDGLGARIVAIEAADKMTDHHIAAKVRAHFSKQPCQIDRGNQWIAKINGRYSKFRGGQSRNAAEPNEYRPRR